MVHYESWDIKPAQNVTHQDNVTLTVLILDLLTYSLTHSLTLTYLLTHSGVQSPSWAANWFAVSQKIPRISRNPKVHYRTHKRPLPVSILGQPNPVHTHTSHLLILSTHLHLGLPSGLFPSGITLFYLLTYLLTYLLHGAESFLSS